MKIGREKGVADTLPRKDERGLRVRAVIRGSRSSAIAELRFQFRSLAGSVRPDSASFNGSTSRPGFISLLQWNTLYTAMRLQVDRSRRNCEVGRMDEIWEKKNSFKSKILSL